MSENIPENLTSPEDLNNQEGSSSDKEPLELASEEKKIAEEASSLNADEKEEMIKTEIEIQDQAAEEIRPAEPLEVLDSGPAAAGTQVSTGNDVAPAAEEVTAPAAEEAGVEDSVEAGPETGAEAGAEVSAEVSAEATPAPAKPAQLSPELAQRRWYIIFVHSGYEHRVKTAIEERINNSDLGQKVFRVLVPEEEIVELRQNRRVERMKKMFPGYVFIEMILDEETWYKIRRTSGVARFIGAHKMPVPISEKEMQRVLRQIGLKEETIIETDFEKDEAIRIISGPFRGYVGTIDECHPGKGKLKALVSIFGRDTPVELDFSQVERA